MTRILVFSPYAKRPHLTAYEGTIAKACHSRGAETQYLLCDGDLPECDMFWGSWGNGKSHRAHDLCQQCRAGSEEQVSGLGVPYRWLGEFVTKEERVDAFAWAQSLSPGEIPTASYMGYPLGSWALSTVVSYFREYPPDLTNWRAVNVYRGYLFSGAVVAMGLERYLETYEVDAALLYNGRQSITRVAFELLQRHGVRELTHETPFYQNGHQLLKPNARCWSPGPWVEFWRRWGEIPLSRPELERTLKWAMDRRYAVGLSWHAYNKPYLDPLQAREELLNQRKRLLALFTSSTDEIAGDRELEGPFEDQSSWVEAVVEWVRGRPDVELVVRVHPHLAGNTGLSRAVAECNFYDAMRAKAPANCQIIMPDDELNSYALMDAADVCLTYGSTPGIEMALMGKRVVLAARAFYETGAHTLNILSRDALSTVLEKSLEPVRASAIQREAFRLAYYYVFKFELPFPLVTARGVMQVAPNYEGTEALLPGRDETLDRICGFLLDGQELFAPPGEGELARTTADEDAFFAELEKSAEPLRDLEYERHISHIAGLNRFGRRVQRALGALPFGIGQALSTAGKAVHRRAVHRLERKADALHS